MIGFAHRVSGGLLLASGLLIGLPAMAVSPQAAPASGPATRPASGPPTLPTTRPATLPATGPARPLTAKPAGPDALPSQQELQAMFDEGKYADVLKELRNVLILRGPAAEPYNKYDLHLLRAETLLRMKSQAAAIASLGEAAETTDDPQKIAYTKAVTLLLKRSRNFQYQPSPQKKVRPPAIDVIEPENRKAALKALLADEMAVVEPKVNAALDGRTLTGIADGLAAVEGLDVLELGVGGGDDARQMVKDLRARGLALMAKTLQLMTTRTNEINRAANEIQRVRVTVFDGTRNVDRFEVRKRGLQDNDFRDLKDVIKTADMIIPNAKGLMAATGGKQREVEDLVTAAEEVKRKAEKTLTDDYRL